MAVERHRRSPSNITLEVAYNGYLDENTAQIHTIFWNNFQSFPWDTYFRNDPEFNLVLDRMYIGVRSGRKFVNPAVTGFLIRANSDRPYLSDHDRLLISRHIASRFRMKWTHLFNEIYADNYTPMGASETRTRSATNTNTKNLQDSTTKPTKSTSKNSMRTPNLTQTRTPNLTETYRGQESGTESGTNSSTTTFGKVVTEGGNTQSTHAHNEFGFNTQAEGGVPISVDTETTTPRGTVTDSGTEGVSGTDSRTTSGSDSGTTTNTGTETVAQTGSESESGSESETYSGPEVKSITGTDTDVESETVTISRTGSMFRPPAEYLSLDRDFWLFDFFDIVFDDLDAVLTLDIYSESQVEAYRWGNKIWIPSIDGA